MKKTQSRLLLFLCCLLVSGTAMAEFVTSLTSGKIYTVRAAAANRGYLFTQAADNHLYTTARVTTASTNPTENPYMKWAYVEKEGYTYLYNVAKKQFLHNTHPLAISKEASTHGSWQVQNASAPLKLNYTTVTMNGITSSGFSIADPAQTSADNKYYLNASTDWSESYGVYNYAVADEGSVFGFEEVGSLTQAELDAINITPESGGTVVTPADGKTVNLPTVGRDGAEIIALSSLEIGKATCGWQTIQKDQSIDQNPITLRDTVYTSGVGTHAASRIIVKLNGAVTRFVSRVGIDDEVISGCGTNSNYGNVQVVATLHGQDGGSMEVFNKNLRATDKQSYQLDIDVNGWKYLILDVLEGVGGNAYDHVDWANAYFEYMEQNSTPPAIVTEEEISSKLAAATRIFAQPGVRMMHRLHTVNPDAEISVSGLPAGLTYNAKRKLVEGTIDAEGDYTYTVTTKTTEGESTDQVLLTVSSNLMQPTPLMGWLSWNVFENDINEEKFKGVVDAFEKYGLADVGYKYVCLDDLWHASTRNATTNKPECDAKKFPSGMKSLTDYVHSKGLKIGIYSDAANKTCAGAFGSYGYEAIDAKQYAEWGFDLLKYDYCFAPSDQQSAAKRYKAMGDALKESGRDILFYMCEWGAREPWKWGAETGATCWRCTYDTRDCWVGKTGGIGVTQSIDDMKDLWPYSGPNRFNDADMMCIGLHGQGKSSNDLCQTGPGMTPQEYQTQFSLWCMWSSPLTLSFDIRNISAADLKIIKNKDLIALNQDRLGQQAEYIGEIGTGLQLYVKDLENGDVAIAVVNLNASTSRNVVVDFKNLLALDATATYTVRNCVKQTDNGTTMGSLTIPTIASHETCVFRLAAQPTAIGEVTTANPTAEAKSVVYDMKGRRLATPQHGEVNIVNGKKVIR